jgi:hypothetical protein
MLVFCRYSDRKPTFMAPAAIQIGACTGPAASWRALWPHLKFYG